MTRYELANQETIDLVRDVLRCRHNALHEAGVTVGVLMAYAETDKNGDTVGTALKQRGHACAALIYANTYKQRVSGAADLTIEIDGDRWETYTTRQRRSRINHEFKHKELAVKWDKESQSDVVARHKHDERPLFTTRYHDVELGWFLDVGDADGLDSAEVEQFQELSEKCQLWLKFDEYGEDEHEGDVEPASRDLQQVGSELAAAGLKGRTSR